MWDSIIVLLIIGIWGALYFQLKKTERLATEGKREANDYMKNILVGIVSGIIVIILDKGVPLIFENLPAIDTTSFQTIVVSLMRNSISVLFGGGLILLLVIVTVNRGLGGFVKKKR